MSIEQNRRLLLLSNSTNAGQGWLEHAAGDIRDFLGEGVHEVLFIPYAGVSVTFDEYAARAKDRFGALGYQITPIHTLSNPVRAVEACHALAVGGGNTFHLVHHLHREGLLEPVRRHVAEGMPYIGWSAGSNVACPGLFTTNDMPIIQPASFDTFGLIPFQINPHYIDTHPPGHKGETREERILEYIRVNREMWVAGLREGSTFRVEGNEITLLGDQAVRVFRHDRKPAEYQPETNLTFLLEK